MSRVKQRFVIPLEDWNEIKRLSQQARATPVMAMSSADALSGNDFASQARQRVFDKWKQVGRRLGFDGETVEPLDEKERSVFAAPCRRARG